MLVNYSQQSSFEQAVVETFGGDRPCGMCKFIQTTDEEGTPAKEAQPSESKGFKLILGYASKLCALPRHSKFSYYRLSEETQQLLSQKVPTPPPESALS